MPDQTYENEDPALATAGAGDETTADQAEASTGRPPADQPDAALEALQREKDELKDRLLRTAAEFQNYRNRMDRERRDLMESAGSEVLSELLPIVDNFERALQAAAPPEADVFRRGVELIHKQMLDLLRKRGVTPIDALGADFDPQVHQAVVHEESAEHREGEVMQELQRGYMLGERLLRPAMVKVAKRS
jgi:molecular chaperone GrpE